MNQMAKTPTSSGPFYFLGAGWRELRRMFDRFNLNRELRRQSDQRDTALRALGEKASEERIDLTGFAEIRDRLQTVATRSGELETTARRLESQQAELETERRKELDSAQARRRAVEEKKRPIDVGLASARERHSATEHSMAQARTRLASAGAELEAVRRELDHPPATTDAAAARKAAEERQGRLRAEQGVLADTLAKAEAALPGLATEVAQLQGEVDRYAAEIAAIEAERKATIGRLDGELGRVGAELRGATQQQQAVGTERGGLHLELGRALYQSEGRPPALDESVGRVAAIDATRADLESRLQGSLAETQDLPPRTRSKFWATVFGVPLLMVAVAYGSYALVERARLAPATDVLGSVSAVKDLETRKDEAVQRFIKAGKRSDDETRRAAMRILKEDVLTMGGTADRATLPTLVTILRSDDAELRAAAAEAIGMIRPRAAETDALARLLEDPAAPVAQAARHALQASDDPAARELAAR